MSDAARREAEVESPCVNVCALDSDSICLGCGRSLDEIAQWRDAGRQRRLEIRADADRRLRAMQSSKHSDNPP